MYAGSQSGHRGGHARHSCRPHSDAFAATPAPSRGDSARQDSAYGRTAIAFEPNAGRTDARARFIARGRGHTLFITRRGSVVRAGDTVVRSTLLGARPVEAAGAELLPGVVNWHSERGSRSGIPTYGQVIQRQVYPGIDLLYHGTNQALEYDFRVAPGADPGRIALAFSGVRPRLASNGDLLLGSLRHRRPVATQDGRKVPASFVLDGRTARFELGDYDRAKPLLIDPELAYSTYVGGSAYDDGAAIGVDSSRNAYLLAQSDSPTYPGGTHPAGTAMDFAITKLNPSGSAVVYTTYIGGAGFDMPTDLAVTPGGEVYVTGTSDSAGLGTAGVVQQIAGGGSDALLAKLGTSGSVAWLTYRGGAGTEKGNTVTIDAGGDPVFGGMMQETGLATPGVVDTVVGSDEGFVAKLNATGTATTFFTYLGGSGADEVRGVAVDGSGRVYAAGVTSSADLTVTNGSTKMGATPDVFLVSLNSTATTRNYATYYGGTNFDSVEDLSVDQSGRAAITGWTDSTEIGGAPGGDTAFLYVSDASGGYHFATTIGTTFGIGFAVIQDAQSNIYVSGFIDTTTGTLSPRNAVQTNVGGGQDGFIVKYVTIGIAPGDVFTTYLGGFGSDVVTGLAVDGAGGTYAAGRTASTDFPTKNPLQPDKAGGTFDAFVTKLQNRSVVLATTPAKKTAATSASFTYSSGESGGSFKCRIDGGSTGTCPNSGKQYAGPLADGTHTFEIEAFDAGSTGSGGFSAFQWQVDTTPPGAPVLTGPADGADASNPPQLTWDAAADATTGVEKYRVKIDGTETEAGCCSFTPAVALTRGRHTWSVTAVDGVGLSATSAERTFTVPIAASFTVAPNPALVGRSVTFDGSSSGPMTRYQWDLDGNGSFEFDGASPTASRAYTSAGDIQVSLRVTDPNGLTATATQALRVTSGAGAVQLGVTINNGAQYTRSPDVTVSAAFPSSTSQMLFSNDGGFLAPSPFAPQKTVEWKLDSSGPERLPKTIYVRFMNGPIASETFQDDIILDETPPTVQTAALLPAAGAAQAARASKVRSWRLKLKASDSNSGVAKVQVTANMRKPGKLLTYRTKLKVTSALRPKFVRARDRAGNLSRWKKIR